MITSNIGKIFLKAYNEKYGTDYDAKTFFVEVYCPLFFGGEKYFYWPVNSPFVQGLRRGVLPTTQEIHERVNKTICKIESNDADASIAIGYPSLNVLATTSGQVSNIKLCVSEDDKYYSWIGSGLGVGVGEATILFFNTQLLLDIFEGWMYYRNVLNTVKNIKAHQIETWNGKWLAHRYSKSYIEKEPLADFSFLSNGKDNDGLSIETQSWTTIMISISKKYRESELMLYTYKYGGKDPNKTFGFIPCHLDQIRRPFDFYKKIFKIEHGRDAEKIYGDSKGFIEACKMGAIGIQSMEPSVFKNYWKKREIPKFNDNEEQIINFNTYQIWLLAMLNNEELWAKAQEFATELHSYASSNGDRGKTINSNKVIAVLESTHKRLFIENLKDIVSDTENIVHIKEVAALVNTMPTDNVPYFLTLIRFHYAAISNNKKQES